MAKRLASAPATVPVIVVLGEIGLVFVRLKPYQVEKHQGRGADLQGGPVCEPIPRGLALPGRQFQRRANEEERSQPNV